jgi:hypothetical protein
MTPYFAGRLAEAQLASGDVDAAADRLDRLLAGEPGEGEGFWDVELLRLRATVGAIRHESQETVRRDLDAARQLAERQGARALAERLASDDELNPRGIAATGGGMT